MLIDSYNLVKGVIHSYLQLTTYIIIIIIIIIMQLTELLLLRLSTIRTNCETFLRVNSISQRSKISAG